MPTTRIWVDAPRDVVFGVLTDAAAYAFWVVGSKRIRGVDPQWPQPGSAFHHVLGWGPFEDRDSTEVLAIDPPGGLVLKARAWPFGTAKVTIILEPQNAGTAVAITEEPMEGPAAKLRSPAMDAALWTRNLVSLRRLKFWAEQRHRGTPGRPAEASAQRS